MNKNKKKRKGKKRNYIRRRTQADSDLITVNGGGEVMTDTGLQFGCFDEIPGVL